jgi:ribonuclease P/MRP protein subunit POP3
MHVGTTCTFLMDGTLVFWGMSSSRFDSTSLLTPLGEHRRTHIQPFQGKKRKRTGKTSLGETSAPPAPAIASHVLVGLNSVTRHLEALAASSAPPTVPVRNANDDLSHEGDNTQKDADAALQPLSMVILTHPQPALSPSHAHIPTLVHLATLQSTPNANMAEPTRLIALATSNDVRFANALHIPRVGAIGIYEGAPGAKALEEYMREHVGLTECLWVGEAMRPEWRGLNVQQA